MPTSASSHHLDQADGEHQCRRRRPGSAAWRCVRARASSQARTPLATPMPPTSSEVSPTSVMNRLVWSMNCADARRGVARHRGCASPGPGNAARSAAASAGAVGAGGQRQRAARTARIEPGCDQAGRRQRRSAISTRGPKHATASATRSGSLVSDAARRRSVALPSRTVSPGVQAQPVQHERLGEQPVLPSRRPARRQRLRRRRAPALPTSGQAASTAFSSTSCRSPEGATSIERIVHDVGECGAPGAQPGAQRVGQRLRAALDRQVAAEQRRPSAARPRCDRRAQRADRGDRRRRRARGRPARCASRARRRAARAARGARRAQRIMSASTADPPRSARPSGHVDPAGRSGAASAGSWVISSSVVPVALAQREQQVHHRRAGRAGRGCRSARRPAAARGSGAKARASATRCCSPPESWPGRCVSRWPEPDRAQARLAPAAMASRRPASSSGTATFSSAVMVGIRWNAWNTMPTCSRRSRASASSSSAGELLAGQHRRCRRWRAPARPAPSAGWSCRSRTGRRGRPPRPRRCRGRCRAGC